jgi:hypothetical protein
MFVTQRCVNQYFGFILDRLKRCQKLLDQYAAEQQQQRQEQHVVVGGGDSPLLAIDTAVQLPREVEQPASKLLYHAFHKLFDLQRIIQYNDPIVRLEDGSAERTFIMQIRTTQPLLGEMHPAALVAKANARYLFLIERKSVLKDATSTLRLLGWQLKDQFYPTFVEVAVKGSIRVIQYHSSLVPLVSLTVAPMLNVTTLKALLDVATANRITIDAARESSGKIARPDEVDPASVEAWMLACRRRHLYTNSACIDAGDAKSTAITAAAVTAAADTIGGGSDSTSAGSTPLSTVADHAVTRAASNDKEELEAATSTGHANHAAILTRIGTVLVVCGQFLGARCYCDSRMLLGVEARASV